MELAEAIKFVEDHGISMLTAPGSNLTAVAVSTKEGIPITEATDFTVTAFVPHKLTRGELTKANIEPFDRVFTHAIGAHPPKPVDIDIVESGTAFQPQGRLSVPAHLRGLAGGPTPLVDSQKYFLSLRSGIGITNPVGDYPGLLSVGTPCRTACCSTPSNSGRMAVSVSTTPQGVE